MRETAANATECSRVQQQYDGLGGYAFAAAQKSQLLGGGRLIVHVVRADLQQLGNLAADLVAVRPYFRRFGKHGDVSIAHAQFTGAEHVQYMAHEALAVSTLPTWVGVFEMLTDIPQSRSAQ